MSYRLEQHYSSLVQGPGEDASTADNLAAEEAQVDAEGA